MHFPTFSALVAAASSATLVLASPMSPPSTASFDSIPSSRKDVSIAQKFIESEPEISALLNNSTHPLTVFLSSDMSYKQNYSQPMVIGDKDYNEAKLQYITACDIHTSESLKANGTTFLKTFLTNPKYTNVTGGAVIKVVNDSTGLYLQTGINDRANITEKVRPHCRSPYNPSFTDS